MTTSKGTRSLAQDLFTESPEDSSSLQLSDGARVGVIGGGPAGSLFSYFLLTLAERVDLNLHVDIYEPRDYTRQGPAGCNHCGGIVSESLVQTLGAEGITLPEAVIQRGINSYTLHMGVGSVQIATPGYEKRIAAVYRGAGPRGMAETPWQSFDAYLLNLAKDRGANVVPERVTSVTWDSDRPQIATKKAPPQACELVVAAMGVNTNALGLFEQLGFGYHQPKTTKTHILELPLGSDVIRELLGSSMHIFLLNIPRLDFAALIPKGEHVTLCMLGEEIDEELVSAFLENPEVRRCLPPDFALSRQICHCSPRMSIGAAHQPYSDRVVLVGDCGVTRLYKDGIGAAYKTAKAAASTAVFHGVSTEDFKKHFWPACHKLQGDNAIGRVMFTATRLVQRRRFACRAALRMAAGEQRRPSARQRMSSAMWDLFTGSAPYREVLLRSLHPFFLGRFLWGLAVSIWPRRAPVSVGKPA